MRNVRAKAPTADASAPRPLNSNGIQIRSFAPMAPHTAIKNRRSRRGRVTAIFPPKNQLKLEFGMRSLTVGRSCSYGVDADGIQDQYLKQPTWNTRMASASFTFKRRSQIGYRFSLERYRRRLSSGVVASAGATGIREANPSLASSINQVTNTKAEVSTGMPVGSRKTPRDAHTRAVTNTPITV